MDRLPFPKMHLRFRKEVQGEILNTSIMPITILLPPSIMMTNIYRDLAIQFIQSPQSNIVMMQMASAGISSGRVKVTIELEIDGAV
jgi:hypothetical protein